MEPTKKTPAEKESSKVVSEKAAEPVKETRKVKAGEPKKKRAVEPVEPSTSIIHQVQKS